MHQAQQRVMRQAHVTQRQRPEPVGDEVLDFEVVGESGFQLVRASGLACQDLLVAESS